MYEHQIIREIQQTLTSLPGYHNAEDRALGACRIIELAEHLQSVLWEKIELQEQWGHSVPA